MFGANQTSHSQGRGIEKLCSMKGGDLAATYRWATLSCLFLNFLFNKLKQNNISVSVYTDVYGSKAMIVFYQASSNIIFFFPDGGLLWVPN